MSYYRPENLPNLDSLFELLTHGQTPNFFEMMSVIEEIGSIYPEQQQACPIAPETKKSSCLVSIYPLNASGLFCPNCG